jgi:hypothetical protein
MPRKLKTYQTSLGFFEQAIAAPSMKAALEAWGADSNLFHQGAAKESTDPDVIAATMKKPGVVLKRPVGSDGCFGENAELPKNLGRARRTRPALEKAVRKSKKSSAGPNKAADRKAAQAYERERSDASAKKPRKRLHGRRSVGGSSRLLTRRRLLWTRRKRSTRNGRTNCAPNSKRSRRRFGPRKRNGTKKRSG